MLSSVEMTMNNSPLSHVEDDVQSPFLTPNMMLVSERNASLETNVSKAKKERNFRMGSKYLQGPFK